MIRVLAPRHRFLEQLLCQMPVSCCEVCLEMLDTFFASKCHLGYKGKSSVFILPVRLTGGMNLAFLDLHFYINSGCNGFFFLSPSDGWMRGPGKGPDGGLGNASFISPELITSSGQLWLRGVWVKDTEKQREDCRKECYVRSWEYRSLYWQNPVF